MASISILYFEARRSNTQFSMIEYLVAGYVALLYGKEGVFLGTPLLLGIQDMEAVEHVAHIHFILVGKDLAPVEILVCRNLVIGQQTHDDAEKVLQIFGRFLGIVERQIGALSKV